MKNIAFVILAATSFTTWADGALDPLKHSLENTQASELSGTFQSTCSSTAAEAVVSGLLTGSFGEAIKSSRIQLIFPEKAGLGDKITRKEVHYTGKDCDGEAYTFEETGAYVAGEKTSKDGELRNLDITFDQITVTINAASAAEAANKARFCGRSDWTVESKNVDVKSAVGNLTCYHATYVDGKRPFAIAYRTDGDRLIVSSDEKTVVSSEQRSRSEKMVFEKKK